MAVSTKSRQVILVRSPFGEVSMPRKYIPLLRAGSIVLFVLSVIAVLTTAAAHDIYLRDRSSEPGCAGCFRIAAGMVAHTERAIDMLEEAVCVAP